MKVGVTLATLVIIIIVMLILTTVTLTVLIGDGGIITRARLSTFGKEMDQIKEKVELKKSVHASQLLRESSDKSFADFNDDLFIEKFNTKESTKYKVKNTLLREILYARRGFPSEEKIDNYDEVDFEDIINSDGTIDNIYVIDKETADGKAETYLWDMVTDIVYKIDQTRIGFSVYHSYATAALGINPTGEEVKYDLLIEDDPQFVGEDFAYYEPDLTGYSKSATKIIYYSQTYLTEVASNSSRALKRSDYIELPVTEYFRKEKPRTLLGSEFPEDGQNVDDTETYVFYDYANQVWGNVKTDSSGLECWWVWIPRYAYKINGTSSQPPIDVKFIDVNNKMAKKQDLTEGYISHPAFTEKETVDNKEEIVTELKGIWMSKYEPSFKNEYEPEGNGCYSPDMTGFDENNTYIELYYTGSDAEYKDKFKDEVQLKVANLATINTQHTEQDEIWYDYSNHIWANVKTNANGLESWWVWIPRYAYKIVDGVQETDIIFVDLKNSPIDKAKYGTKLPDGYVVHPAFTQSTSEDGKKSLKGIWISKYEPSSTLERTTQASGVCYQPDFSGYDEDTTYVIYYSKKYLNAVSENSARALQRSDYIEIPYKKYVEAGKKSQLNGNEFPSNSLGDQVPDENDTYVFYDYANQAWGNIKTIANGIECWWVWIPRYAYVLTESQNESSANKLTEVSVLFTDTDDAPFDKEVYGEKISAAHIPHPAFTEKEIVDGQEVKVKQLEGIWMSKYEPSFTMQRGIQDSNVCYAPDLTGFDINNTKIVIYNSTGMTVEKEYTLGSVLKAGASTREETKDGYTGTFLVSGEIDNSKMPEEWYDYSRQKWANIKTEANGIECWWVWIPRYAYVLTESQNEGNNYKITETNILFTDINDNPLDTNKYGSSLPSIYTPHPGFTEKEIVDGEEEIVGQLKGIWMSKYEPSWVSE